MPYTKYISIVKNKFGKVAVAKAPFPKGHLVRVLRGEDVPEPTRTSIQWGASSHRSHREADIGRFINHSCSPNCEVEISRGHIRISSIKNINIGEELSYDYGYEFDKEDYKDHECKCGSKNCIGYIISSDDWGKYKRFLKKGNKKKTKK